MMTHIQKRAELQKKWNKIIESDPDSRTEAYYKKLEAYIYLLQDELDAAIADLEYAEGERQRGFK